MAYLLNLAYLAMLALAGPVLLFRALRHGKYREGWGQKLFGLVPRRESNRPCLWLHAVSVGEVNLLGVLIERLESELPESEIVISTTTKTGLELAQRKHPRHTAFYCPLDFSWAVNAALRRIRPDMLVLAELELWPNLVRLAKRSGAGLALVNGRLGEKSWRGYSRLRPLAAAMLREIDCLAAQNERDAGRFRDLGARPDAVHVTGSLKFDGAETDRGNARTAALRRLAGAGRHDRIFLAGSTQAPEESLAIATYRALHGEYRDLRLILVPRHPERFEEVASLLESSGLRWGRRTGLDAGFPWQVLLVDCVGELGAWWGLADFAFVGGSLHNDRGGQNMIEPAAYGAAVCFGPSTHNFREIAEQFLDAGAAVVVRSGDDLTDFVRRCLARPAAAAEIGRRARGFVQCQLGGADRTAPLLLALLGRGAGKIKRAA